MFIYFLAQLIIEIALPWQHGYHKEDFYGTYF